LHTRILPRHTILASMGYGGWFELNPVRSLVRGIHTESNISKSSRVWFETCHSATRLQHEHQTAAPARHERQVFEGPRNLASRVPGRGHAQILRPFHGSGSPNKQQPIRETPTLPPQALPRKVTPQRTATSDRKISLARVISYGFSRWAERRRLEATSNTNVTRSVSTPRLPPRSSNISTNEPTHHGGANSRNKQDKSRQFTATIEYIYVPSICVAGQLGALP
jgi:hypothetical protein